MKLTLIQHDNDDYERLAVLFVDRRWGALDIDQLPVKNSEIGTALTEEAEREAAEFNPFDPHFPDETDILSSEM